MLISLLVPAALAMTTNELAVCVQQTVYDTVPSFDAQGVPVDVVPQLLIVDASCATDVDFDITLSTFDGVDEVMVHQELLSLSAEVRVPWHALALEEELAPNTAYVLRVTERQFLVAEVSFTTGEGTLEEVSGAPSLESASLTHSRSQGAQTWSVSGRVTPVADPWGVVMLREVSGPTAELAARPIDGEARMLLSARPTADMPLDSVCLEAAQINGRAQEVGVSEVVCVDAERSGCSSAGGRSSGALPLAALALLGAALRRRRTHTNV